VNTDKTARSTAMALFAVFVLPSTAGGAARTTVDVVTSTADVRACAVLEDGGILAATAGGLVRLDGTNTPGDVMTRLDGLPGTQIDALEWIDSNHWWVGTEGGLARIRVDEPGLTLEAALDGPPIRTIATFAGETWVGTRDAGVYRVVEDKLEAVRIVGGSTDRHLRIHDLAPFDGAWVAATAQGLLRQNETTELSPWSDSGVGEAIVWSLAVDGDDLWMGTIGGLFHRERGHVVRIDPSDTRDVEINLDGIEIAAIGVGVHRYSRNGMDRGIDASSENLPVGIDQLGSRRCVATQDGLWLGSGSHGSFMLRKGLPSRDVSAMAWDPHARRMWIGTFDRGVAVGDGTTWTPVASADLDPQINVIALQPTSGDTIAWIGTARGLYRVSGDDIQHWSVKDGLPHHHVQALHVRRNGDVVVGTTTGFVIIHGSAVEQDIYRKRPPGWAVWSIAETADETLYLGTTQGLFRYPKEGSWERYSMLDGILPDNWVTAVTSHDDQLWVGTYAAGVARLRITPEGLTEPRHFGGGRINPGGLSIVDDQLYASTMTGLARLPANPLGWESLAGAAPGLDVKGIVVAEGEWWVASRRGIGRHREGLVTTDGSDGSRSGFRAHRRTEGSWQDRQGR